MQLELTPCSLPLAPSPLVNPSCTRADTHMPQIQTNINEAHKAATDHSTGSFILFVKSTAQTENTRFSRICAIYMRMRDLAISHASAVISRTKTVIIFVILGPQKERGREKSLFRRQFANYLLFFPLSLFLNSRLPRLWRQIPGFMRFPLGNE